MRRQAGKMFVMFAVLVAASLMSTGTARAGWDAQEGRQIAVESECRGGAPGRRGSQAGGGGCVASGRGGAEGGRRCDQASQRYPNSSCDADLRRLSGGEWYDGEDSQGGGRTARC